MACELWTYDLRFAGSKIRLFDSGSNQIIEFDLHATYGATERSRRASNGFSSSAGDIARVDIDIAGGELPGEANDFVTFDDVQFSCANTTAVPDPGATLTMLTFGLAGVGLYQVFAPSGLMCAEDSRPPARRDFGSIGEGLLGVTQSAEMLSAVRDSKSGI